MSPNNGLSQPDASAREASVEFKLMLLGGALLGFLLLMLISFALFGASERYEQKKVQRAEQNAKVMAEQIARAVGMGVPIDRLNGVEAVFQQRLAENADFFRVALVLPRGQVLANALQRSGVSELEQKVSAAVEVNGHAIAAVVIETRPTDVFLQMIEPSLLAFSMWLVAMVAMFEALRFARTRGPVIRQLAFDQMAHRVNARDLTSVVSDSSGHSLDKRPSELAMHLRSLNERYMRVRRLIASLMQTEPSATERSKLQLLLRSATSDIKFSEGKPKVQRLSALPADARWMLFLLATAVGTLQTTAAGSGATPQAIALSTGMTALGVIVGIALARLALASRAAQTLAMLGIVLVILAPVLFHFFAEFELAGLLSVSLGAFGTTLVACGCAKAISAARRDGTQLLGMTYAVTLLLGLQVAGPLLAVLHAPVLQRSGSLIATALLAAMALFPFNQSRLGSMAWSSREPATLSGSDMVIGVRAWIGLVLVGLVWSVFTAAIVGQLVAGLRFNSTAAYVSISVAVAGLGALIALRLHGKVAGMIGVISLALLSLGGEQLGEFETWLLLVSIMGASAGIWALRLAMYRGWIIFPRKVVSADCIGIVCGALMYAVASTQNLRPYVGELFLVMTVVLIIAVLLLWPTLGVYERSQAALRARANPTARHGIATPLASENAAQKPVIPPPEAL